MAGDAAPEVRMGGETLKNFGDITRHGECDSVINPVERNIETDVVGA